MLKGIDQRLSAEIVHVLMLMGHGDDLVICDVNHPAATIAAETTYGRLIDMAGCDIPTATRAILSLLPRDAALAESFGAATDAPANLAVPPGLGEWFATIIPSNAFAAAAANALLGMMVANHSPRPGGTARLAGASVAAPNDSASAASRGNSDRIALVAVGMSQPAMSISRPYVVSAAMVAAG